MNTCGTCKLSTIICTCTVQYHYSVVAPVDLPQSGEAAPQNLPKKLYTMSTTYGYSYRS